MSLVGKNFRTLATYQAGKPIEETKRELGISDVIKLASNENCYGPVPAVPEALKDALSELALYPDSQAVLLKQKIAELYSIYGLKPEHIVVGNGTDELINMAIRTFLLPGENAVSLWPTFPAYSLKLKAADREEKRVFLPDSLKAAAEDILGAIDEKTKLIFLANPNNPSGLYMGKDEFEKLLKNLPSGVLVFCDEAYREYCAAPDFPDTLAYLKDYPQLLVSRTFSKIYGLAALRLGYLLGQATLINYMNRCRDPFNVNSLAQLAGRIALSDQEYVKICRELNKTEREWLLAEYQKMGLKTWPSETNFILVDFARPVKPLFEILLRKGIIIRPLDASDLPTYARITIGTHSQNERLMRALKEILNG